LDLGSKHPSAVIPFLLDGGQLCRQAPASLAAERCAASKGSGNGRERKALPKAVHRRRRDRTPGRSFSFLGCLSCEENRELGGANE